MKTFRLVLVFTLISTALLAQRQTAIKGGGSSSDNGSPAARCFFAMQSGGPILVCTTCSCAELASAGVNYYGCVDALMVSPGGGSTSPTAHKIEHSGDPHENITGITRYSDTKVTITFDNGDEIPLACDEAQAAFDAAVEKGLDKRRVLPTVNKFSDCPISEERLRAIAKATGQHIKKAIIK
jgi:hypothetical protein